MGEVAEARDGGAGLYPDAPPGKAAGSSDSGRVRPPRAVIRASCGRVASVHPVPAPPSGAQER